MAGMRNEGSRKKYMDEVALHSWKPKGSAYFYGGAAHRKIVWSCKFWIGCSTPPYFCCPHLHIHYRTEEDDSHFLDTARYRHLSHNSRVFCGDWCFLKKMIVRRVFLSILEGVCPISRYFCDRNGREYFRHSGIDSAALVALAMLAFLVRDETKFGVPTVGPCKRLAVRHFSLIAAPRRYESYSRKWHSFRPLMVSIRNNKMQLNSWSARPGLYSYRRAPIIMRIANADLVARCNRCW